MSDSEELRLIAREAYIYAFPLVLMQLTRLVACNVAEPLGTTAPPNQFGHDSEFPDPSFTMVVRPNADTLYSPLGYDVSEEPLIIEIPASEGRYFLFPCMDWWTDIFTSPGTRTTGNGAQAFAITGPNWRGKLPDGVREYKSPTARGLMIVRTQTNGKGDYDAVHRFQAGMKAFPLSAHGKPYTAPKGVIDADQDMTPPPEQVEAMTPAAFFETFADVLKDNPPHDNDYPLLDRIRRLGLEPGQSFSFAEASPEVQRALEGAIGGALEEVKGAWSKAGVLANGWRTNLTAIGTYGTDYLHRAGVAYGGLGANVPEDAVYPTAFADADGEPFSSDRRYLLHFDKDGIPPVNAFWSLTMYDERQLFTANPIDRYAIGDRDDLRYNDDGSLDLHIQRESPGADREDNWLPAPASGAFTLNLRLYWPRPEVLDARWSPPAIRRA